MGIEEILKDIAELEAAAAGNKKRLMALAMAASYLLEAKEPTTKEYLDALPGL